MVGTRKIVTVRSGSMLSYSRPAPGLLELACPEQLGLSSIACGLVLGDSIRPCTNGVSLLHRIASVAPLKQTADHVLITFFIHQEPHGARGGQFWMTKPNAGSTPSLPASDPGSTAAWGSKRINSRAPVLFVSNPDDQELNNGVQEQQRLLSSDKRLVFFLYLKVLFSRQGSTNCCSINEQIFSQIC